ncbi:MAG: hypothetical protein K0M47_01480 [Rhizobium sp.]|nr:hypothetical protein [Rhizobium sp.]
MTDQYPGNTTTTTTRPVHPQDTRPMADRGTTVVNNDRSSSTGWAIALIVAVALGIGAVFMFTDFSLTGNSGDADTTAPTTSAPATSAPATPAPTTDAAPAPAAPATPAPSTDAAPAAPAPTAPAPSTAPAPAGQ